MSDQNYDPQQYQQPNPQQFQQPDPQQYQQQYQQPYQQPYQQQYQQPGYPQQNAQQGFQLQGFQPQELVKNLNPVTIIGIVASLLFAIGSFLPYYTVSVFGYSNSISLFGIKALWGIIVLLVGIASAVMALTQQFQALLGIGGAAVAFNIYAMLRFASILSKNSYTKMAKDLLKHGVGFYILLIGALGILGVALYKVVLEDKLKKQQ